MKAYQPIRFLGAVAIATFGLISSLHARFSLHTIDTMAITDMKPAGRAFQVPTAEHPIYYVAVNVGMDWCGGYCPAGEALPNSKTVQDAVVRALARNHYLSADAAHAPTQIIVMAWGYLEYYSSALSYYTKVRILEGDKYNDGGDIDEERFPQSVSFIPHRIIPILSQAKLHDYARGSCYYVDIRSYGANAAEEKQATYLWETRIACPSAGLAMDSTLPTMVRLAARQIGIETKKEVFTTPEKSLHEDIQTGEIHVLNDAEVNQAQVIPLKSLMKPDPAAQAKPEETKSSKSSK